MAKCAYCAEPLPDSDDEECDEGKEEDDGGCGEGGFCDDFCREMKEDDRRWDQETLGFSLSEQLAKACFLGNESRVEKLLSKGAPVSQAVPGAIAASLGCALRRLTPLATAGLSPCCCRSCPLITKRRGVSGGFAKWASGAGWSWWQLRKFGSARSRCSTPGPAPRSSFSFW